MRDKNENTYNSVPAVLAMLGIVVAQIALERFARKYRVLRMFKSTLRVGALLSMLASLAAGVGGRTFRLGNLIYISGRWIQLPLIVGVYGPSWPHPMRPEREGGIVLRNGNRVSLDIDPVVLRETLSKYGIETTTYRDETSEY